jgi:hypothetical protein
MAKLTKSSRLLKASGKHDSAATVSRNRQPPTALKHASDAAGAAEFDPQTNLADSEQFRADILRRYDAPFALASPHGGLSH